MYRKVDSKDLHFVDVMPTLNQELLQTIALQNGYAPNLNVLTFTS